MADETANSEQTMEQELEALFNPTSAAPAAEPGKGATPEPGKGKEGAASLPPSEKKEGDPEPEAKTEEDDPLLKALDEIEDGEPKDGEKKPDEGKPALSDEQQQILRVIPDAQTAAGLYNVATNYSNFTGALEAGDYDGVLGMLQAWNPSTVDGLLEHIYTKYAATGEWVDRFIAEQEGKGTEHKGMKNLEKQVAELRSKLEQKQVVNTEAQQQDRVQKAFVAYNDHIHSLFEKVNFNKADRKWVVADLNARVAADPKILTAIKSGDVTAVNKIFKAACKEYLTRDKQVAEETGEKVQVQSQKKLPIGGAAVTETAGQLPDDVRQVPKGQEDSWLDQQLGKLFGRKK